ncbi:hypothetical protein MVEN_01189100 [Mycena venus]|uniref:Fucose-specific lectin n=1 Tax=Mycena venus TaxID=2733690 RepID=A0A8H7CVP4_9AGAR|nr:hypothetical protein MVEN_01189100 [Mycena venus]
MFILKLICLLPFIAYTLGGLASNATTHTPSTETNGFNYFGAIAAVQVVPSNGQTRLYFQNSDNSIQETAVTAPFVVGNNGGSDLLVPAQQVLQGTPIAATLVDASFSEIHVYFFSPSNILSEYIYSDAAAAWRGGASCSDCIDRLNIAVQPGSRMLYAMGSTALSNGRLRVGFVSAETPGTVTEADYANGAGWRFTPLQ